jgi:hypothetical protein
LQDRPRQNRPYDDSYTHRKDEQEGITLSGQEKSRRDKTAHQANQVKTECGEDAAIHFRRFAAIIAHAFERTFFLPLYPTCTN